VADKKSPINMRVQNEMISVNSEKQKINSLNKKIIYPIITIIGNYIITMIIMAQMREKRCSIRTLDSIN
jgi:hypothetical protein